MGRKIPREMNYGKGNRYMRQEVSKGQFTAGTEASQRTKTSQQITWQKLRKNLEEGKLTHSIIIKYQNLLYPVEYMRFLNMPVLGAVILFLESLRPGGPLALRTLTPPRDWYAQSEKFFLRFVPTDESLPVQRLIKLRLAATFFRYYKFLLEHAQDYADAYAETGNALAIEHYEDY